MKRAYVGTPEVSVFVDLLMRGLEYSLDVEGVTSE
jgi:hypothetical protein